MAKPRGGRSAGTADTAGQAGSADGATAPATPEPLGFEAALEELETLVGQLEDGELELEQALASFERGVALSRRCSELLDRAERRIEMLVDEGGRVAVRPIDPEDLAPSES